MQPLIDVHSLARALAGPPGAPDRPVVLDVRWRLGGPPGAQSYRAGHLPGAVFIDLDRELCGPPGPAGRHPLPAGARLQQVMRHAGVSAGRPVVVYDDADSTAAARAWWTLRYFGHAAVRVLDGGYRAWTAAGYPVTGDSEPASVGDFTAVAGGMPVLDAAAAATLARRGVLLDARAAQRYRGEVEPVDPVAGHIPGSVNAPTTANVATDGRFISPAELRARFGPLVARPAVGAGAAGGAGGASGASSASGAGDADSGSGAGTDVALVGVYCGSGVTAAHEVLALELAGIPAALYVGSWSEWITDPARPVAVGPGAG